MVTLVCMKGPSAAPTQKLVKGMVNPKHPGESVSWAKSQENVNVPKGSGVANAPPPSGYTTSSPLWKELYTAPAGLVPDAAVG
jgi:hypothetical protein